MANGLQKTNFLLPTEFSEIIAAERTKMMAARTTMSDISSFSLQNPKQVRSRLSLLLKHKCLLRARFGINNESYITTLLAINEENNTVILDYGPKEDLNYRLLYSSKVTFDAEYRGIKVSFVGAALKKTTYKGELAFIMPMPKVLFWMERREFFRVKAPVSDSSYCQLTFEDREPIKLKLHDISLSGFALYNDSKEIFELLVPGASFERCKLSLSGSGKGMISFEICYNQILNPDKVQKIQKIGCRFTKITNLDRETIQRYLQGIQREDLQRVIR